MAPDALVQQPPSTNSSESKVVPVPHVLTVRLPPEPATLEAGAPDSTVDALAPSASEYSTCDRALDRL